MKQRCYYTKHNRYQNYGGRGIKVCSEWNHNATKFITWMLENNWEKGLQIDRKDNDSDYSPENCKLSTPKENSNNRSKQMNNTSGFVGVTLYPNKNYTRRWMSYIYINRKRKHIGYFISAYEAAVARDNYIKEHNLQHKLNFEGGI